MAIYNVDSINEQELVAKHDDILDNMLEACDNMLTALDESKARRRYMDILDDQADKHKENSKKYESIADDLEKLNHKEAAEKYRSKARGESFDSSVLYSRARRYDPEQIEYVSNHKKSPIDAGKEAEARFKSDFKAYPAKEERKPGMYKAIQDKKRSIKETCLTILSVLDEI